MARWKSHRRRGWLALGVLVLAAALMLAGLRMSRSGTRHDAATAPNAPDAGSTPHGGTSPEGPPPSSTRNG